jgi:hypothetical protein
MPIFYKLAVHFDGAVFQLGRELIARLEEISYDIGHELPLDPESVGYLSMHVPEPHLLAHVLPLV